MTWEIAFIFALLAAMLASFAWEKLPTELTALCGLAILMIAHPFSDTGILSIDEALRGFSNPAPITVGAMFVLSAALERCGLIQAIANSLQRLPGLTMGIALPALILCVAAISAFINNTPVVVVFLPVVLSLAKRLETPASKLLIPLSYASILGGTCTLVGTSTNIVISSMAENRGLAPFSMFEIGWVGVPMLLIGTVYLMTIGRRLLPERETITSILTDEERREYILEAFVNERSPLIGNTLADLPNFKSSGLRALEIIRNGIAMKQEAGALSLLRGDRVLIAASARALAAAQSSNEEALSILLDQFGLEQIAAVEGSFVEVALRSVSNFAGRSFGDLNFRQHYRLTPVAIHRKGRNISSRLNSTPLEFGDIFLMLGSREAIDNLKKDNDFVVLEETRLTTSRDVPRLILTLGVIAAVIGAATANIMPIAGGAIIGSVILLMTRCLSMTDAYKAINWPILFLIFAMLGIGQAMESSGASAFLADSLVRFISSFVAASWQPIALLAGVYLLTTILTEVLSNNAAAVLMTTIAFGMAQTLEVDAKPFLIAIAMAASASFATPIGYQTNTYVYGIGGYRFTDFLKIGIPLNAVAFVVAMIVIPILWKF